MSVVLVNVYIGLNFQLFCHFSTEHNGQYNDCMYIINMIKELLCLKHQQFELSSSFFNR